MRIPFFHFLSCSVLVLVPWFGDMHCVGGSGRFFFWSFWEGLDFIYPSGFLFGGGLHACVGARGNAMRFGREICVRDAVGNG